MESDDAARRTIGVVIRTLDESELIGSCLESVRAQQGCFDLDFLVVDSGSTDATVEIARSHGARIAELAPGDFDYSKALNLGIDEVRGEIVVSLSAHAIPVDDAWLQTMTAPFDDPAVAGVSSRQVPWPDAPWHEVKRLSEVFGEASRSCSRKSPGDVPFSNAASAIRRSAWREHPFTLPAVEDLDWARRIVAAGWEVVYESGTAVYHSHREGPRAQALRLIDINRLHHARHSRLRSLREAAGHLRRNAHWIVALDDPSLRKLAYLAETVGTAWFYVVDFSRAGTTAERRRESDVI